MTYPISSTQWMVLEHLYSLADADGKIKNAYHHIRTLEALKRRGLLTFIMPTPMSSNVTLTDEGIIRLSTRLRYCPRCHGLSRASRGQIMMGPCPCRWHDDADKVRR